MSGLRVEYQKKVPSAGADNWTAGVGAGVFLVFAVVLARQVAARRALHLFSIREGVLALCGVTVACSVITISGTSIWSIPSIDRVVRSSLLRLTSISATPPASRRLQRPQGPHRERPLRHLRRSEPGRQRVLDLGTIPGAAPPYEGERHPKRLPTNLRCSPDLTIATRGPLLHHQVSTLNRVIGGMVIVTAFILPFFMDWVSAAPSSAQFNYRVRSIGVSFTNIYPHGIRSCCSSCGSRAPWTRALTSKI